MTVGRTGNKRIAGVLRLLSRVSPAALSAGGVLLIAVMALFVPPYVGMADNGDFFRVLYGNGLYITDPDYDSKYLGYFVKDYGILQYYNENGSSLFTSQSLFIDAAMWLNKLFYSQETFDLRFMAAVYTLLYTGAVYLFVEGLTWKTPRKYGYPVALLAIFMFGDTAYTAYFNSFYSESVSIVTVLYIAAAVLLLCRGRYNDYVMIGLFMVCALLLTTSKQQNAPVGILLAVGGTALLFLRKGRTFRALSSVMLALLVAAGICTYVLIPKEFVNINQYHAMTRGILLHSSDPEQTLGQFGINKQFAILKDSIYYDPYTTADVDSEMLEERFFSKYNFLTVSLYYVTHPGQMGSMLDLAAENAFAIRPAAMGNYEEQAGKPYGAQTIFFSGYSILKQALSPKTFGFIMIWFLVVAGLYMPSFIKAVQERRPRDALKLPFLITMVAVGLSGIAVSIIGAGDADLAKHEFLFTLSFDVVTFIFLSDVICKRLWSAKSKQPAVVAALQPGAEKERSA